MHFKQADCRGLSDKEVVSRSLEDLDYFTCLVIKYETRLLAYIQKILLCGLTDAEDILQEGFIKIWKNIKSYDNSLTFENWIFRIMHNEAISYGRKKTSYAKNNVVQPDDDKVQPLIIREEETDMSSETGFRLIEVVLPKMKPEYREVLVLRFLEGKSYDEISDILKIPEGTVATRINRAKKSFRDLSAGKVDNQFVK